MDGWMQATLPTSPRIRILGTSVNSRYRNSKKPWLDVARLIMNRYLQLVHHVTIIINQHTRRRVQIPSTVELT